MIALKHWMTDSVSPGKKQNKTQKQTNKNWTVITTVHTELGQHPSGNDTMMRAEQDRE